ncbi:hypothetical protein CIPAW_03G133900 [Carya illinoinensis]|uniref:Uncharacterized protein n=1 Tax=Carya illinoinensis TaxID=32201 RepID=A0A8T1R0D4_CARIL|nr:hypothetical protein CIPAW_03G133900 [Carya illinoinensis]
MHRECESSLTFRILSRYQLAEFKLCFLGQPLPRNSGESYCNGAIY